MAFPSPCLPFLSCIRTLVTVFTPIQDGLIPISLPQLHLQRPLFGCCLEVPGGHIFCVGTIHLTACGCSGSTKEMLVSQKGSLSAVEVRGGLTEVGEGVNRVLWASHTEHAEARRRGRVWKWNTPLKTTSFSNTSLWEILALPGILGDLIFYILVLDLAHTFLNFGYQPGMVAFGGREASLHLGHSWEKSVDLSELQWYSPAKTGILVQTFRFAGVLHDIMKEMLLHVTIAHFKAISFPPLAYSHRSTLRQPLILNCTLN